MLLCCGVAATAMLAGCSSKQAQKDELGAKDSVLPESLANYSAPLDLSEFDVTTSDDGQRGVFLKLSRLPTGVTVTSLKSPRRALSSTFRDRPARRPQKKVFPAGDTMVTHIGVSRTPGWLRVVLDLQGTGDPTFAVYPMADWVVVRINHPPRNRGPGRTGRVERLRRSL